MIIQRSNYIDFCKGILILLVSIGHAIQCAAYQETDFFQDPTFKAIYMFHMPLFMAISGYVSFGSIAKTPPGKFISTKAFSLLMPIFVWEILFKISTMLVFKREFTADLSLIMLTEAVQSLWFLWALFACLALTAIANKFGRYSLAASLVFFIVSLFISDKGIIPLFKYTYPYFLLGYYISFFNVKNTLISIKKFILPIFAIATIFLFILWQEKTYVYVTGMAITQENIQNIILRYVSGFFASGFFLCIFYRIHENLNVTIKNTVISFGKDSLYIYIISQYLFIFVTKISLHYFERAGSHLQAAAISLSVGIFITLVCWIGGNIIAKNRIAARLLFGKSI